MRRAALRAAGALAAAVVLLAGAPRAAAEPVEIAVLTYNTHGLPSWIAGDDPPARYPRILAHAERYDVVLIQEDFAHQPVVDEHARHPHRVRGNAAWLPLPLFAGSGLTLLSRLEGAATAYAAPYGICHGWVSAANDCLGHKGFLMARLALAGGAALDVWNTHLDAGPGEGDQVARAAQLDRLVAEMERRSGGRAVVAGGDFNLDWDEPAERALLDGFLARTGLAVAALTPAGAWDSRLDYLLVRSAPDTRIDVLASGKAEEFVDAAGRPLSDHPAVFARLRIHRAPKVAAD